MRVVRILIRLVVALLLLVVVVAGLWWLTHRDQARATWRAAIIATELQGSSGSSFIRDRTATPLTAQVKTIGGLPATFVRPGRGSGPWPTVVLVVPAATNLEEQDVVLRAQRGLARAGFAAWAVRAPDVVTTGTSDARLELALTAVVDADTTRARQISVLAVGLQATQVVDIAARAPLAARIHTLLLVQPVADVHSLLRLAVTGTTRGTDGVDRAYPAAAQLRPRTGRALVAVLRARPAVQRSRIATGVLEAVAAADDPLTALRRVPSIALPLELRAAQATLATRDPVVFDARWEALPAPLRAPLEERSALLAAARVQARVLVVADPGSTDYPATDAERLATALGTGGRGDDVRYRSVELDEGDQPGLREAWPILQDASWWLERAAN